MLTSEIPKLIRNAFYCIDLDFSNLMSTIEKYQQYGLDIDPDFQRPHVWTDEQQIAFIEYILIGGQDLRAKVIQCNCPGWQSEHVGAYRDFVLVDGKQRLEALRRFLNNEIGVFNGHKLDDFEDKHILLRRFSIKIAINELKTKDEVLVWYLQINSGGTIHTQEEIDKVLALLETERLAKEETQ